MVKKPKQPTTAANIKKELEAFVGHEIDVSEQELIKFSFPAGSYAYFGIDEKATVTWKNIFPPGSKTCARRTLLDASGVLSTLADGKRTFLLSEFVCFPFDYNLQEPINVVATSRTEKPLFLSMTYSLVPRFPNPNSPTDVQITVFAWDVSGTAAPGVSFHWRCRVVWGLESPPS